MRIEWVPNISEGRDAAVIDEVVSAAAKVPGVQILHVDAGWDANRTVITAIGAPAALEQAAINLVGAAHARIDMRIHQGTHPCLGAVDVSPFVPLFGAPMEECAALAKRVGAEVAAAYELPVYLYEHAASSEDRRSLAIVRGRGYRSLEARLLERHWKPDFGPARFDPSFGALICGARELLVAFNVNLESSADALPAAVEIAERIRESGKRGAKGRSKDEGCLRLPFLRAIGWELRSLGVAQVSMNLTKFAVTGMFDAFEACRAEAARLGLQVAGSELVGMVPKEALLAVARRGSGPSEESAAIEWAANYLGLGSLRPFHPDERVLELALGCRSVLEAE